MISVKQFLRHFDKCPCFICRHEYYKDDNISYCAFTQIKVTRVRTLGYMTHVLETSIKLSDEYLKLYNERCRYIDVDPNPLNDHLSIDIYSPIFELGVTI